MAQGLQAILAAKSPAELQMLADQIEIVADAKMAAANMQMATAQGMAGAGATGAAGAMGATGAAGKAGVLLTGGAPGAGTMGKALLASKGCGLGIGLGLGPWGPLVLAAGVGAGLYALYLRYSGDKG